MRVHSHTLMNMRVNEGSMPLIKWIEGELEVIILQLSISG